MFKIIFLHWQKKANSCVKDVEQVLKYFHGLRPGIQEYSKFTHFTSKIYKSIHTIVMIESGHDNLWVIVCFKWKISLRLTKAWFSALFMYCSLLTVYQEVVLNRLTDLSGFLPYFLGIWPFKNSTSHCKHIACWNLI